MIEYSPLMAKEARRRKQQTDSSWRMDETYTKVLIVDDVVTTGETTRQLALALRAAGVRRVSVLAVARAS